MTFWEANRFCSNSWNGFGLGALVSIQTRQEYDFLVNSVASTIHPMADFWIGLTWRGKSVTQDTESLQCSFNWNDKNTPTAHYQPDIFEESDVWVSVPKSQFMDPGSRAAVLDPSRCEVGKDLECWAQRAGDGLWRLAGQVAGLDLGSKESRVGSLCKNGDDGVRLGFVCRRELSVLKLRDWGLYGMSFFLWGVFGVVCVVSGIVWFFVACCVALRCPETAHLKGNETYGCCDFCDQLVARCLKLDLKTVTLKDSVRKGPEKGSSWMDTQHVKLLDLRDWEGRKEKTEEIGNEIRDVELIDADDDWDSRLEKYYTGVFKDESFPLQRHTIVSSYCCRWAGWWSVIWVVTLTIFSFVSSIISFVVGHVSWSSANYVFLSVALAGIALCICVPLSGFGLYNLRMQSLYTQWNCRVDCPTSVLHVLRYILPSLLCPPYGIYFLLFYVFGLRFCTQCPPERELRAELVKERLDIAIDLRRRTRNKVFGVRLAFILQKTKLTDFEEVLLGAMGEVTELRPFSDSQPHQQKRIKELMNWKSETPDNCDEVAEPPDMRLNPIPYFCAMEREGALESVFEIESEYCRLREYLRRKFDPFQQAMYEREGEENKEENGDRVESSSE